MKAADNESRGLIIQPGALGDGILTLPLARLLRRQARIDHIDLMGHREKLGFLQGRSEVAEVIALEEISLHRLFGDSETFDLSDGDPLLDVFRDYQLIVTFLADERGHFERNLVAVTIITHAADVVTVQLHPPADYCGHVANFFMEQFIQELPHSQVVILPEVMEGPLIQARPGDMEQGWAILKTRGIERSNNIVLLHPGSGGAEKCWPVENFLNLSEQLAQREYQPIFLLGPVEQERWDSQTIAQLCAQVPVFQKLTIEETAAVLSCCWGYVGNDSGITHLAGAMGLVTVAIFGPTNPTNWHPLGENVRICHGSKKSDNIWASTEEVITQLTNMH